MIRAQMVALAVWNPESVMQIVVNGQAREVAATTTVAQLLADLQLPLRQVAVEVNRDVVPRQRHDVHRLAPGDEVEVVTLVGGG